jgi:hypothetical protein
MVGLEEARAIAISMLHSRPGLYLGPLALRDELSEETEHFFVFYCDSEAYVRTGEHRHRMTGNGPILVDRELGFAVRTGTSLQHDYIRECTRFRERLRTMSLADAILELRTAGHGAGGWVIIDQPGTTSIAYEAFNINGKITIRSEVDESTLDLPESASVRFALSSE